MSPGSRQTRTCLITTGEATVTDYQEQKAGLLETIRRAANGGVDLVQIREKALNARLLFDLTRSAVDALLGTNAKVLVNDRADIAMAAGAQGVHLPANSISPFAVRLFAPRGFIVGLSTHTLEEAVAARDEGASFITFGPIFASEGKPDPAGSPALREVCEALAGFPVYALGGLDASNVAEAVKAGASGVAAIRALNETRQRLDLLNKLAR